MAGFSFAGKGRRILGLAIIVVPWFLRDQIGAAFDSRSAASQQIRVALDEEEARQAVEVDQRATTKRIVNLERQVAKVTAAIETGTMYDAELDSELTEEAAELTKSVTAFTETVRALDIDEDAAAGVLAAGDSAKAAAEALVALYKQQGDAAPEDAMLAHFDSSAVTFRHEIQVLSASQTMDAEFYSTMATFARFGAWVLTAVGATMMGGWKALVRGLDAEGTIAAVSDAGGA